MIRIVEYYKNKIFKESEFDDDYDAMFGEPTTEVLDIYDFLNFLDNVIKFTDNEIKKIEENSNEKYNLKVKSIVATQSFETALKSLYKKHRTDIIKQLKDIIIDLGNYKIKTQKDNHPLKNMKGNIDLHIDGKRIILLYKYIYEDTVMVGFSEEQMTNILKLQDIVNHKELKRYDRKKFKFPTHEFDLDKLNTDQEVINNDD